jgi:hypothetical protein
MPSPVQLTLLLHLRERSSPFQGRTWLYHLALPRRWRHLKTFRLFLLILFGASFFPRSIKARFESVRVELPLTGGAKDKHSGAQTVESHPVVNWALLGG